MNRSRVDEPNRRNSNICNGPRFPPLASRTRLEADASLTARLGDSAKPPQTRKIDRSQSSLPARGINLSNRGLLTAACEDYPPPTPKQAHKAGFESSARRQQPTRGRGANRGRQNRINLIANLVRPRRLPLQGLVLAKVSNLTSDHLGMMMAALSSNGLSSVARTSWCSGQLFVRLLAKLRTSVTAFLHKSQSQGRRIVQNRVIFFTQKDQAAWPYLLQRRAWRETAKPCRLPSALCRRFDMTILSSELPGKIDRRDGEPS